MGFIPPAASVVRKHRAELGVAIVQRVSPLLQESPGLAGRVARHLLHPSLVGMPGDSGQANAATLQVNEEQDVICHQPTPGELWIPKTPSGLKVQVFALFVRSSSFPRPSTIGPTSVDLVVPFLAGMA